MIVKEESGTNFILIPAGNHQAVCYDCWDLGVQKVIFNGEEKMPKHKLVLAFEINERIDTEGEYNGKRYVASKRYTRSLHEKSTLRKDLEGWRGRSFTPEELKGFELDNVIGKNCMINIIHNKEGEKIYANISAITKLPKGLEPIIAENQRTEKGCEPEWIKKIQAKALDASRFNHTNSEDETVSEAEDTEEIPF